MRRGKIKARIADRRKREAAHKAMMAALRPLRQKYGALWGHGSELAYMAAWAEYSAPDVAFVVVE